MNAESSPAAAPDALDLIWGAAAIREALGLQSDNQVYSMLRSGVFNGVVKHVGVGKRRRLCASRRALAQWFAAA